MKVAIVHDYIKEYGGAERVLEALHEVYPDATVFTSVYLPSYLGPHRARFKDWKIKTTWLQWLPFKAKLISPMRLLAPFAFRRLNFEEFDLIIVSATGSYFPNRIKKGKALQICYCHTPPRYLYGYSTAREWKRHWWFRLMGEVANHFLRIVDSNASDNVDFYIANSKNVARRIKKFYRRDSTVIYPPVDTNIKNQKSNLKSSRDYYLAGGRLARPKKIDLAIQACTKLGLPLKIFGKEFAGYGDELRKLARLDSPSSARRAGPTIEFVGEISDSEKYNLMHNAKAFIFPAEDEDFGITPVEAMACGTPVIAYRSGGVVETVLQGRTGVFFDEPTVESLTAAIKKFEKLKFDSDKIELHAQKFSKERFEKEIREFIKSRIK